jgi:hypothetical protein
VVLHVLKADSSRSNAQVVGFETFSHLQNFAGKGGA